MTKGNTRFLAFLAGLFGIAMIGMYVIPQFIDLQKEPGTGTRPATPDSMPAEKAAPQDAAADTAEAAKADAKTSRLKQPDLWAVPSFDVLRVEPDGSTVIAGKAEPGTRLDIMNGDEVIASSEVGPSGDFVAILDTPLAPGDYLLTLRIVGEDGLERRSEEVATVSIPEGGKGELLAMVSKPGSPSRIVAQPAAPVQTQPEPATVTNVEPSAQPVEVAAAPTDVADGQAAVGTEQAAALEAAPGTEPAITAPEAAPMVAATSEQAPIVLPELPATSMTLSGSAPEIAVTSAEGAPAAEASPAEAASATTETAPAAQTQATQTQAALPADANVRVDAVEIEGDKLFVAGSATRGYRVVVSANDVEIGSEMADENGRFVIEAVSPLAVGDHTISADLVDPGTGKVMLRAAVPFNRPQGENLAAVAAQGVQPGGQPAEDAGATTGEAAASGGAEQPSKAEPAKVIEIGDLAGMREEAYQALTALEALVNSTTAPDAGELAAARADATAKLKAVVDAAMPEAMTAEGSMAAEGMKSQAVAALSAIASLVAGDVAALPDAAGMEALRAGIGEALAALTTPAEATIAAAQSLPAETAAVEPAGPATIQQAPLKPSPETVIIRRGDTLWQISRRTYGQGVRYTTIYLANQSQIQNPDKIVPGQIFSVPEKPLENAEELHRQRLQGKNPSR